jgi:capsular polysaccharide biosynthesis protein
MSVYTIPTANVVELINGGDTNPYHLFFYMIANFSTIDCNSPVLYFYAPTGRRLVEELLALLPPHFIRDGTKRPDVVYRPFLNVKPFFKDWVFPSEYDFLRALFRPHYTPCVEPGTRLYISRNADASNRRIANEAELLEVLVPLGFRCITMSEHSVKEQMGLFSKADVIVSPHGAAMSFLVFGSSDTTVLELARREPDKRHFSHIAWHLEMDYTRMYCEHVGEDMRVDVDRVAAFLRAHPKLRSR